MDHDCVVRHLKWLHKEVRENVLLQRIPETVEVAAATLARLIARKGALQYGRRSWNLSAGGTRVDTEHCRSWRAKRV
jgi:hypothetical protein